jgi:hypothetical protein
MSENITLAGPDLNLIIQKAIVDSLSPESRNLLIGKAVKELISKKTGSFGRDDKPSPLEEMFGYSVQEIGRALVREYLENNEEFKTKVKACIAEAVERAFNDEGPREKLIGTFTDAIAKALGDRY